MQRYASLLILSVGLLVAGCGLGGGGSVEQPRYFRFLHTNDSTTFVAGTSEERDKFITGPIASGNGGHNGDFPWHFVEGEWELTEVATEVCDARWYHRRMPSLLLSVSAETRAEAAAHVEQIEPSRLVAFAGVGPPSQEVLRLFASRNVPVTVGTFGALDERARQQGLTVYRTLFEQGVGIVATDETALASQAAATYQREPTVEARP